MNPRQRRGVLLISVAVVAAIAVTITVLRYLSDVRSELGPMVSIVATTGDLPAYRAITLDDLATEEVPDRWAPVNVYRSPEEVLGLVTSADVPAGTLLSHGLVQERPSVQPGQREIAIMVDAETGVAGKISSGDVVDIFATFQGADGLGSSARIVVQRARILEVGVPVQGDDEPGSFATSGRVPVTFLLSVTDARTLTYVESFSNSIRLALRSPLDDALLDTDETVFMPAPDELGRLGDAPPVDPPPDDTLDSEGGDAEVEP